MANDYANAWDALSTAIGAAKGESSGSIEDIDHLTFDEDQSRSGRSIAVDLARAVRPKPAKHQIASQGWHMGGRMEPADPP